MSIHKLSAGDGYTYYLRETASADELRASSRELGDYYLATGNPPGIWMGGGLANLSTGIFAEGKLNASITRVSGTVTEAQMKALFGEGIHPNADAMAVAGASKEQIKLGRGFYQYDGSQTLFSRQVRAGFNEFKRRHKTDPTAAQRRTIRGTIGAKLFFEEHGRRPANKEELGRFMTASETPSQQAVTGFDVTFAPVKSVSLLWALGGEETRKAIEKAQSETVEAAIAYYESRGIYTRSGFNGVEQRNVQGGVISSRFRHYDSRTGDPHIHDHVTISNRVLAEDGKTWLTLDGQQLYKLGVEVSEFYNTTIMANVCEAVGATTVQRDVGGGRMVTEIAGVDEALIKHGSTRNTSIRKASRDLVKAFIADHGYSPNKTQRIALAQQATLDTRPVKEGAHSPQSVSAEAVKNFTAAKLYTTPEAFMEAITAAKTATEMQATPAVATDVAKASEAVLKTVSAGRSVWGEHHVRAEAFRYLSEATPGQNVSAENVLAVTDLVLNLGSVSLSPAEYTHDEPSLHRADGKSIYAKANTALFTSTAIIAAEDHLLTAAQQDVIPAASAEQFTAALAHRDQDPKHHALNTPQLELAKSFALSSKLLTLGIGPAGTGKTTSMSLAVNTINRAGGRVIGLATSANAADVLRKDLLKGATSKDGVVTETVAKFLDTHVRQGSNKGPNAIRPGDVIILDEAGMTGTADFAAVVAVAERYGARVGAIGDHYQLSAVGAGGAFRLIAHQVGAVELEDVHRFVHADGTVNQGEADASLLLRDPEKAIGLDAFGYYLEHGLITAGDDQKMIDDAYASWQADTNDGLISLMMAADRVTVTALNERAQAYRVAAGTINATRGANIADGVSAYTGDTVLTRKIDRHTRMNQGKDFVKNGDLFTVKKVHRDGSVTVRHLTHKGTAHLSADYMKEHLQLGYAATFNGAQGATVDTTASILRAGVTRAQAYVGATRGQLKNKLFTILGRTDPNTDMPTETATRTEVLEGIAASVERNLSAHEIIETTAAATHSVATLRAQYINTETRAQEARVKAILRTVLGVGEAAVFIDSPAFGALAYRIREAEAKGLDANWVVGKAHGERGFEDAVTAGAVLTWRIERLTLNSVKVQAATIDRPLANITDENLKKLKAFATDRHHRASAHLAHGIIRHLPDGSIAAVSYPEGVKPWNERPFGNLSAEDLDRRITATETKALYFIPSQGLDKVRKNTWLLNSLKEERDTRANLDGDTHQHEMAERGLLSVWAKTPAPAPENEFGPDMPAAGLGSPTHPAEGTAHGQTPSVFGPQPKPTTPQQKPAAPRAAAKNTTPTVFDTSVGSSRRLSQSSTILERILVEEKLRAMLPDTSVTAEAAAIASTLQQDGVPEWVAPTHALALGLATGTLGETWSAELLNTRDTIATELRWAGHLLAADQPTWAASLGPVPSEPEHQAQWKHTAALVSTFRDTYNVSPSEVSAIPAKFLEPATGKHQDADDLAAMVTAIHKYTGQTLRPAATEESLEVVAAQARIEQLATGRTDAQKLIAAHLTQRAARVELSGLQQRTFDAHSAVDVLTNQKPSPTVNDDPSPTTTPQQGPEQGGKGPGQKPARAPEPATEATTRPGTVIAPVRPIASPRLAPAQDPTARTLRRAEALQQRAATSTDEFNRAPAPTTDLPEALTPTQEQREEPRPEQDPTIRAEQQQASERERARREEARAQSERDRHQETQRTLLLATTEANQAQQEAQAAATRDAEHARRREQARQELAEVAEHRAEQQRLAQVATALSPYPEPQPLESKQAARADVEEPVKQAGTVDSAATGSPVQAPAGEPIEQSPTHAPETTTAPVDADPARGAVEQIDQIAREIQHVVDTEKSLSEAGTAPAHQAEDYLAAQQPRQETISVSEQPPVVGAPLPGPAKSFAQRLAESRAAMDKEGLQAPRVRQTTDLEGTDRATNKDRLSGDSTPASPAAQEAAAAAQRLIQQLEDLKASQEQDLHDQAQVRNEPGPEPGSPTRGGPRIGP